MKKCVGFCKLTVYTSSAYADIFSDIKLIMFIVCLLTYINYQQFFVDYK